MKPMTMRRAPALLLAALLLSPGCAGTGEADADHVSRVDFVMDTWVEQRWYGDGAQQTCDEILAALLDLEARLSLYRDDSEIARFNEAAGLQFVPLSAQVYDLLERAVEFSRESDGLFDITVAPLTIAWNITGQQPKVPPAETIEAARALVDYRDVVFDEATGSAMLRRSGMRVDLGGIAKGMAAGMMRRIARQNGVQGYLSIGGNMMVEGKKPDKTDFVIGLRAPRGEASELLGTVALDGLTMATTGDYERYFELDGLRYHHVFDPFTGHPAQTDLIAVTVISADGTLADCYSTTIFLQGAAALADYFDREDCMVLAVTKNLDVYASPSFWERMQVNESNAKYTFHRPAGAA
jgi:thiamine biosynthesis lipoprotein